MLENKIHTRNLIKLIKSSSLIYSQANRFQVYQSENSAICIDLLCTHEANTKQLSSIFTNKARTTLHSNILANWIPPVINTSPIKIENTPRSKDDINFWQYPCTTEKQAFEIQSEIMKGQNYNKTTKTFHSFLPLPWATYIDKESFPKNLFLRIKIQLLELKSLANSNGYKLQIHTVCQHINWSQLTKTFDELGITDLHLSHCEKNINPTRDGFSFKIHSWPLIAVNIENPERSKDMIIGKSIKDKKYLATFIGASASNYRTDVRSKILDTYNDDQHSDILVELTIEWHFQKIVYDEQVNNIELEKLDSQKNDNAAYRYNKILSDSVFSLCPEGTGPNTLRFWESLAVGAIPVVISDKWIPPSIDEYQDLTDCIIFYPSDKIDSLFTFLRNIRDTQKVLRMQKTCIKKYELIKQKKCFRVQQP